ncbi:MAG: nucleoside-diphosphate kinase [Dehalococcoidales bacterium]|nr:nucleoside-diphosphate kinase [Dehalococcoidales bacterium]
MQKTVVILKPDALQRGIIGEIVARFERKGLKIVALKMVWLTEPILDEHYAHHKDEPFFGDLKKFMISAPVVAMILEGKGAISLVRRMVGATNSRDADLGSVRADYSISTSANIIHVSDSEEAAGEEIERFFDKTEIYDWDRVLTPFFYAEEELK